MPKLLPELKMKYRNYIKDAERVIENLQFLLENLGFKIEFDYSSNSLENLEKIYWTMLSEGIPSNLSDDEHFAHLIGQYLGQCLIVQSGAKWIQCKDANPLFGQPCVDGFGNKPWDRVYPVEIALNLKKLPKTKPNFSGVKDKRVFAAAYEKAMKIYNKKNQ